MKKLISGFIVVLILGVLSFAAHATEVDLAQSSFNWKATKKLSAGHWGNISLKSAKVDLKEGKLSNAEFTMDMSSFTVDNLEGKRKNKFLNHVKSGDFFEVEKYPTAKLTLDKLNGDNEAEGKLTIKDKTHPVKIKFAQNGNAYSGTLKFDRTKYDVVYGSGNFFKELLADKIINDEVTLNFKVVLK